MTLQERTLGLVKLAEKATRGTELIRYEHGGGRELGNQGDKGHDLVAEYYDEPNREYTFAARNDAPEIAKALDTAMHYLREGHEKLHGSFIEHDNCMVKDFLHDYFGETK